MVCNVITNSEIVLRNGQFGRREIRSEIEWRLSIFSNDVLKGEIVICAMKTDVGSSVCVPVPSPVSKEVSFFIWIFFYQLAIGCQ